MTKELSDRSTKIEGLNRLSYLSIDSSHTHLICELNP